VLLQNPDDLPKSVLRFMLRSFLGQSELQTGLDPRGKGQGQDASKFDYDGTRGPGQRR
jgi:hypothetical protein